MSETYAIANQVMEWSYISGKSYADPFNEVVLDVVITEPDGNEKRVPAFWGGENVWRVRYASGKIGTHQFRTICSDQGNPDLHGQEGQIVMKAYSSDNPLFKHGRLRISENRRYFEHEDGTPFLWVGDTWWMGFCKRLSWPQDVQLLTADRVAKGFSVIQIVAGLYPDMPEFDKRGANEAGLAWEPEYARINPAYYDMADLRLGWILRAGLLPCIVGCWAYYLGFMGVEKMKQHWRYLIARWGAYPVVWCLAGEASMPFYLSKDREGDKKKQMAGWTEMGMYVRETDPYSNIITIHPSRIGRNEVDDDSIMDFEMLQSGHEGYECVEHSVASLAVERDREPTMPIVQSEVNYEGIIHDTAAEVQRLTFWATMLSGGAGHTYAANGIWQVNTKDKPYGASPHGGTWGDTDWREAYQLDGSFQVGLGGKLLGRYEWWEFEPHQDWVDPCGGAENVRGAFAAGIAGQVRIIYCYDPIFPWIESSIKVVAIEPDVEYTAFFWNPRNGEAHDLGVVEPDAGGCWQVPLQPTLEDWVLVLHNRRC